MKQYTSESQTAKLIELGFEKPKGWYVDGVTNNINLYVNIDENPMMFNYSIGELLSFLPQCMDFDDGTWPLSIEADPFKVNRTWWVFYEPSYHTEAVELIDAIFDMIVKLKEK